jgi:hypothetical protein
MGFAFLLLLFLCACFSGVAEEQERERMVHCEIGFCRRYVMFMLAWLPAA